MSSERSSCLQVMPKYRQRLRPRSRIFWARLYTLVDMQCWVPNVRIITVLPAVAGKGPAAEHVRQVVQFPPARSMWAGDTRGDSSLLWTQMRGALVGNATPELREDAERHGAPMRVHQALATYAAGVLEGMRHHNLDGIDDIQE